MWRFLKDLAIAHPPNELQLKGRKPYGPRGQARPGQRVKPPLNILTGEATFLHQVEEVPKAVMYTEVAFIFLFN